MQALHLESLGLEPVSAEETTEINGGVIWWVAAAATAGIVAIVNNFGDFLHGVGDALNGVSNPPATK